MNNENFDEVTDAIRKYRKKGISWDELKNFDFLSSDKLGFMPYKSAEGFLLFISTLNQSSVTYEDWVSLVESVEKRESDVKIEKMGPDIENNAQIPTNRYSSWKLYEGRLKAKGWSQDTIQSIEHSSFSVLRSLSQDFRQNGSIKGLVIGDVQSGKTANMAGLMAMAADNGFNVFIVLSGVIENLRKQTAERLYKDVASSGSGNLNWKLINNPSLRSNEPQAKLANFNLKASDKDRYFMVCLKNKARLNNLKNWLFSENEKAKQMKILVIDDEADQASINTNNIEDENPTAINKLIKEIVNSPLFGGMNYIAYTATPYANILNETGNTSLYPKDFIALLTPSPDYIGPKQLFGTEIPEVSPELEITRPIEKKEVAAVMQLQEKKGSGGLPESMTEAIRWFLITVAAMRALEYRDPISMLVHTSFKINHHVQIAQEIAAYLQDLRTHYDDMEYEFKRLYDAAIVEFSRKMFLQAMPGYTAPEEVPDYPEWEAIKRQLDYIIRLKEDEYVSRIDIGDDGTPTYRRGIHLCVDNSQTRADSQFVRLIYPDGHKKSGLAPAFIVVGGNTLSRGLTLEGLTTSYFLRTTNQADTLMQMARWFGFRKGYELFPRVWMDEKARERYMFLSQLNEELRSEMRNYAKVGRSPGEYAPRVKNSPNYNLIRITSAKKMQSAQAVEFNFSGFNTQTVYFRDEKKRLQQNLKAGREFLVSLGKPVSKSGHLIWTDVDLETVSNFLNSYQPCEEDIKMRLMGNLIDWLKKENVMSELAGWSVILSGRNPVEGDMAGDPDWTFDGRTVGNVFRTKLTKRSNDELTCIGSLRSPSDLLIDITQDLSAEERSVTKLSEVQNIRRAYGFGAVPQLIIYRIDKNSRPAKEHKNRSPLEFSDDILGVAINIPGMTKTGNSLSDDDGRYTTTTYVSAIISPDEQNVDEEQFREETED